MSGVRNKHKKKVTNCPDALLVDTVDGQILLGMYELIEGERRGGLVGLNVSDFEVKGEVLADVGVLDVKRAHGHVVAACSDGTVRLVRGEDERCSISVSGEEEMKSVVMAVTGAFECPQVASITTAGELQLSDLTSGCNVWRVQAHSKAWESWIVASDGGGVVATGSDDCSFRLFDVNAGKEIIAKRFHESGVTWLDFESQRDFSLITGSYDERMAFWDTRNFNAGPLKTVKLDGGVWRSKKLPGDDRFLVAMCYGGFGIYDLGKKVLGSEDLELCYGVDVLPSGEVVALDFYQKTVSAYSVDFHIHQ